MSDESGAKIRVLDPSPNARNARNAFEVLEERATCDDEIVAVVIIEIHKNGTRMITKSLASHEEVCFMKAFFDSWIYRWFGDDH